MHTNTDNLPNNAWSMPDRHIRATEVGDSFQFGDAYRVVKTIKRGRESRVLTFEDGLSIDVMNDLYDDRLVDVTRPRKKHLPGPSASVKRS